MLHTGLEVDILFAIFAFWHQFTMLHLLLGFLAPKGMSTFNYDVISAIMTS